MCICAGHAEWERDRQTENERDNAENDLLY